jgi:hypothetical protein
MSNRRELRVDGLIVAQTRRVFANIEAIARVP